MAELTETATEAVAEAAETVAEQATTVAEVSRGLSPREIRLVLAGIGLGAAVGAFVGGRLVEKRLRTKYQEYAENEIDQMREHFRSQMIARERKPDLGEMSKKIEDLGYSTPGNDDGAATPMAVPPEEPEEPEQSENNIFDMASDKNWDFEAEKSTRSADKPYVIHVDEYGEERSYSHVSFVYYAGDDTLADEREQPVDDIERTVGQDNLDKFGHGSGDPNVVYVRNDRIAVEFEILRSDSNYAEQVAGIEHSDVSMKRRGPTWDG
jgi:hypothetical protein